MDLLNHALAIGVNEEQLGNLFVSQILSQRNAGLYEEALKSIDQWIAANPRVDSLYYSKGYILQYDLNNQGLRHSFGYLGFSHECLTNYQQAIVCYDKVSTLILQEGISTSNTDNTPTLYQLVKASKASCLMYLSKNEEAECVMQEVLALNPSHGDALIVKARLLNLQGKYDEAIRVAELVIEADKHYTYPHHCKAVAMFHLGKYAEAIDCFALAFKFSWLPLNPSQVKYRYQEALNILEQIINIEANTPNASRAKEVRDFALNQMKETKLDKSGGDIRNR